MKKFLLCSALVLAASPAFAQVADVEKTEATAAVETVETVKAVVPAIEKIEVNKDGSLTGNVFTKVAGEETPVDAKVTLASEGIVIDAVQTENGSFSFANIAPGAYTLTGTTQGFAGGQAYDVAPFAGTGCTSCNLGLESVSAPIQQSSPIYNAPCESCGSTCSSCGGGGFGGGGGGGLFGGGGSPLRRRLLTAGLIGGTIAIAVSDDDDASPVE